MQIIKTLIVDDDASFRRRVKEFLAAEPDIQVIGEAEDGDEAILKARELKPDLVLLDVRMPRMSGITAAQQLNGEMPGVKVIMLTVFDLPEYRETAIAIGANDYVVKKSLIAELLPTIRHVCFPQGPTTAGPYKREKGDVRGTGHKR